MEYKIADKSHVNIIAELVAITIKGVYPKYYPQEAVDYFVFLHNKLSIGMDISKGNTMVLYDDDNILVGTGTIKNNYITRVFVLPETQGKGYGKLIMNYLEKEISKNYTEVFLDSSLPAGSFYEARGYRTTAHNRIGLKNEVVLVYEEMKKDLFQTEPKITYNGRKFFVKNNSASGVKSSEIIYMYHQVDNIVWADYSGDKIKKGSLIGKVNADDSLGFYYQHIDDEGNIRIGKCHSTPQIKEDKSVELHEKWHWLNQDLSDGESILEEIK